MPVTYHGGGIGVVPSLPVMNSRTIFLHVLRALGGETWPWIDCEAQIDARYELKMIRRPSLPHCVHTLFSDASPTCKRYITWENKVNEHVDIIEVSATASG